MREKSAEEKARKRVWKVLLIICMAVIALNLFWELAACMVHILGCISFPVREAASIGIIGGADGPTAIIISTSPISISHILLELMLLAVCILGVRHLNG